MEHDVNDLIPVPEAVRRAGVARNTMHRAAKSKAIKAVKIGRDWFVHASDVERWKREVYRPDMALKFPPKSQEDDSDHP
jgi:excisionase family DNA binding protein